MREAYGEARGETKLRPKSRDMRILSEVHVVLDSGKEKKKKNRAKHKTKRVKRDFQMPTSAYHVITGGFCFLSFYVLS